MKSGWRWVGCCAGAVLPLSSFAQLKILDPRTGLQVGSFAGNASLVDERRSGAGFGVSLPGKGELAITMPTPISLGSATHLDLRLGNRSAVAGELQIAVSSGNGLWHTSRLVLAPGETLDISVPLVLAQNYGMRCLPPITDKTRYQTASVGTIDTAQAKTIHLYNLSASALSLSLPSMEAKVHTLTFTGMVDDFGQLTRGKWPNKVTSVAALRNQTSMDAKSDVYAYSADAFGGVLGGPNYGVAPRFRTLKDGSRWFLVTPAGNRFFSFGVNEVGIGAWTQTSGRMSYFSNLKGLAQAFPAHFEARGEAMGFSPYTLNLERKYGANWQLKIRDQFVRRLKTWGFNTLGVGSYDAMVGDQRMVSTFGGSVTGTHRRITVYDGRAIHDPFDATFATSVQRTIVNRVATTKGDHSLNLGIFIDNELPWGDRNRESEPNYRYGIAIAALYAPPAQPAHAAFIQRLQRKYTAITRLNIAWGTSYSSWATLDSGTFALPATLNANVTADLVNFTRDFATKYFSTVREELTRQSFSGLYLGCRFAGTEAPPEVLEAAKPFVDVLSFNVYHARPSTVIPFAKTLDHPVLISEFAFGSNDFGRIGVPYYPSLTDSGRSTSVNDFVEDVKSWTNLVGAHWYRWEDLPATAKVDGDNAAHGLLSIADTPYSILVNQMQSASLSIMANLRTPNNFRFGGGDLGRQTVPPARILQN